MIPDAQYEIKGLLGKGLGLSKYGTHVAFVGGTGILTFIDLITLLIRVNLEIIDPYDVPIFSKGSTFRFILFVSFASRREAIALPLLEAFDKYNSIKGFNNFELHLRLGSEKSKGNRDHWDDRFIEK